MKEQRSTTTRDRVIVVGGGLAGLTTAVELVDRDFDVTLIEAAPQCGGKLASWRTATGDPIEHGMHGWWPNYVNFFEVMKRVGISLDVLRRAPGSEAVLRGGESFSMKPVHWPSPIFLLGLLLRSPIRRPSHVFSVFRAAVGILGFDSKSDFARLDGLSFHSWLKSYGVGSYVQEVLFEPYVRSFSFDSSRRTSAAATLSSLHFYLIRHAEDVVASWLVDAPDSLIIDPIVKYIEDHGSRVICDNRVTGLVQGQDNRVVGVKTSDHVADPSVREPRKSGSLTRIRLDSIHEEDSLSVNIENQKTVVITGRRDELVAYEKSDSSHELKVSSTSQIATPSQSPLQLDHTGYGVVVREAEQQSAPAVEFTRMKLSSVPANGFTLDSTGRVFLGRLAEDQIVALSAICTHMGDTVDWTSDAETFKCPAHGAEFSTQGAVLTGPATKALHKYDVRVDGPDVVVLDNRERAPGLEAEHVVLAVDVENCKKVIPDHFRDYEMFRRIDSLSTTPVLVVRLWFDDCKLLGKHTSGIFVNYPLLDNFFVLSNLQKSFLGRDETVIEVQAYLVEEKIDSTDHELLSLVMQDLYEAFETLKERTPRDYHILRHRDVFTHHNPNSNRNRPGNRTSVTNLHLAGDWVSSSPAVWHMERAVVSGMLAAKSVIKDAGGVGPSVRPFKKGGVLFRVCATLAQAITRLRRCLSSFVRSGGWGSAHSDRTAEWGSTIIFGVYKFPGGPTEQLVTGKFRSVEGQVNISGGGDSYIANGKILVDLHSVDSGNTLRDIVIRKYLFGAPVQTHATFEFWEAKLTEDVMSRLRSGETVSMNCEGKLGLNGRFCTINVPVMVSFFSNRLVSVLSSKDIVINTADFGVDVGLFKDRCGAVVDDQVNIRLRLAVQCVTK